MSPLLSPHREFLVDQVAAVLRREITDGRWRDWLPAERELIKMFNVCRVTLRSALRELVDARELKLFPRHGYQVSRNVTARTSPPKSATKIGLICPEKIYSMPAYMIQLVDILRSQCAEAGLHLEILEGPRFARTDPGRFMPRVVRSHPKACWIPIMANRRMQEWFARTGTPAVIYGNVYPDIRLSSAGIDYRACIRHATSFLLGKGHRRIALVIYDQRHAGEQESVSGFREAFRMSTTEGIPFVVERPDDDAAVLRRQIDRLLEAARPPTAFIVCRTYHYATVATHVLEGGRRVPADVSLMCRSEDTFLHFLSPAPTFYRVNVELMARSLFRRVMRVADGAKQPLEQIRVVPAFVPGASTGPCRDGDAGRIVSNAAIPTL